MAKRKRVSWCKTNPSKASRYNKKYREEHKEEYLQYRREWTAKNPRKVKNTVLKRNYGITIEQYEAMLAAQGNACAVCGDLEPHGKGWHVDHCHVTKKVRGILCHFCNVAIGNAKDDPVRLRKAADYLERA